MQVHHRCIITEGSDLGTIQKVCANPACPVHHPKPKTNREDENWKAQQAKQRREQAISELTGIRVLSAIGAAVPVRLMKRDLQYAVINLANQLGEMRLEVLARQHGIKRSEDAETIGKLFAAFVRRADEGALSRLSSKPSSC